MRKALEQRHRPTAGRLLRLLRVMPAPTVGSPNTIMTMAAITTAVSTPTERSPAGTRHGSGL